MIGIVTNRDIDFVEDRQTPLKAVMTTSLVTAQEGISLKEANALLRKAKKVQLCLFIFVYLLNKYCFKTYSIYLKF